MRLRAENRPAGGIVYLELENAGSRMRLTHDSMISQHQVALGVVTIYWGAD